MKLSFMGEFESVIVVAWKKQIALWIFYAAVFSHKHLLGGKHCLQLSTGSCRLGDASHIEMCSCQPPHIFFCSTIIVSQSVLQRCRGSYLFTKCVNKLWPWKKKLKGLEMWLQIYKGALRAGVISLNSKSQKITTFQAWVFWWSLLWECNTMNNQRVYRVGAKLLEKQGGGGVEKDRGIWLITSYPQGDFREKFPSIYLSDVICHSGYTLQRN